MCRKRLCLSTMVTANLVLAAGTVPLSRTAAHSLLSSSPAICRTAQDAPVPTSTDTLDRALVALTWDSSKRGPLLVVNPQGTVAVPSAELLPASERARDATLRVLAARFGRQMMPVRSLTALVPTRMVTLNSRPGNPNPYAGMLRSQKVQLLMGSLTVAQWRALGSPQGLGAGDLSEEQQPLFLSLLPEPFALNNFKMDNGVKLSQPNKAVTLTPQQRAGVHLRVNRAAEMYLPRPNNQFGFPPDLQYYGLANGTEFYTLVDSTMSARTSAFGAVLRTEVPNRLKPGDLAFNAPALNVTVPLADAKNVGDLVWRIARATHLELIADGRVAALPVWTRGASARAGDTLQALCLAVTGTLRRVGPAFVLTSDLEGIGTRHARLADWAQNAAAQRQTALEAADKAAVSKPEQYIGFAPDYPFAFNGEALQKLTANGPEPGQQDQYDVPLASLPSAQQVLINGYFAHQQKNVEGERVKVALTHVFSYVVPGLGAVNEADVSYGNIGLPAAPAPPLILPDTTVALPATSSTRGLLVRPANTREVVEFAQAARRRGMNQLWVEVGEGAAGQKLLREAITAAKENRLEVVAVLRLLQIAQPDVKSNRVPQDALDQNLLNETGSVHAARLVASLAGQHNVEIPQRFGRVGDWLRPDAPATLAYLQQRLREIAVMPGLSGLAFTDTAPPGYLDRGIKPDPFSYAGSYDFGYTPAMRLAYLRQAGYDPIDLIGSQDPNLNVDLSLPFFPAQAASFGINEETGQVETQGSRTALQDWKAYRYKVYAGLLAALHAFAGKNYPDLPLLLRQSPIVEGWWSGWDKTEKIPEVFPMNEEVMAGQAARTSARPLLLNIAYAGSVDPKRIPTSARHFALWVQRRLKQRGQGWNGVVIDLSALPADQTLDVLEGLRTQNSP